MDENSTSNYIKNDNFNLNNNKENDYINLINRLKEISKNIRLLEKTILK